MDGWMNSMNRAGNDWNEFTAANLCPGLVARVFSFMGPENSVGHFLFFLGGFLVLVFFSLVSNVSSFL